jgi:uncharacterized membrane protein
MSIKSYLIALPIFFIIDMIWLSLVASNLYKEQIGFLMRNDVNWVPALIFYFLFVGGMVFFVIDPAIDKGSWVNALLLGVVFGVVCYATYDLTNLATLKDWPLLITLIDIAWGGLLVGSVSVITYFLSRVI